MPAFCHILSPSGLFISTYCYTYLLCFFSSSVNKYLPIPASRLTEFGAWGKVVEPERFEDWHRLNVGRMKKKKKDFMAKTKMSEIDQNCWVKNIIFFITQQGANLFFVFHISFFLSFFYFRISFIRLILFFHCINVFCHFLPLLFLS